MKSETEPNKPRAALQGVDAADIMAMLAVSAMMAAVGLTAFVVVAAFPG